jgi:hypothetical protein
MSKLRLVKINTTAYSEEDFLLVTDLSNLKIELVIEPIIDKERNEDIGYDNEDLVYALKKAYPKAIILNYNYDNMETISV